MRPKLQKQSALKLAGRIIPQSGGVHTRDYRASKYVNHHGIVNIKKMHLFYKLFDEIDSFYYIQL